MRKEILQRNEEGKKYPAEHLEGKKKYPAHQVAKKKNLADHKSPTPPQKLNGRPLSSDNSGNDMVAAYNSTNNNNKKSETVVTGK